MKKTTHLSFRLASIDDEMIYFNWVNDASVRRFSFTQNEVSIEEHRQWFRTKINSANDFLYVFYNGAKELVGQVRFNDLDDVFVGVSIDAAQRGKGYAVEMIQLACAQYFSLQRKNVIFALIKVENKASINAFENAGFILFEQNEKGGYLKYKLSYNERF